MSDEQSGSPLLFSCHSSLVTFHFLVDAPPVHLAYAGDSSRLHVLPERTAGSALRSNLPALAFEKRAVDRCDCAANDRRHWCRLYAPEKSNRCDEGQSRQRNLARGVRAFFASGAGIQSHGGSVRTNSPVGWSPERSGTDFPRSGDAGAETSG